MKAERLEEFWEKDVLEDWWASTSWGRLCFGSHRKYKSPVELETGK